MLRAEQHALLLLLPGHRRNRRGHCRLVLLLWRQRRLPPLMWETTVADFTVGQGIWTTLPPTVPNTPVESRSCAGTAVLAAGNARLAKLVVGCRAAYCRAACCHGSCCWESI